MAGFRPPLGGAPLKRSGGISLQGVLAEVTHTSVKLYSNVNSFEDLRLRITDDFPELVHYNYRISVNHEIVNQDPLLRAGDQIAYLPPFTGG